MDPNYKYILCIDIGINHLAFVLLEITKDFDCNDIIWFDMFDITKHQHLDKESEKKCELYHTKTIADWLSHIFYLHHELFEHVDYILIERQPPTGLVAVEQLIYFKYRNKSILIHPKKVHSFFGWKDEYEQRKEKSVKVFKYRLEKSQRIYLLDQFNRFERQHDISDAYILSTVFLNEMKLKNKPKKTFTIYGQDLTQFGFSKQ